MAERYFRPFEVGRRGKPDEHETQIASELVATLLEMDENVRCDLRVAGKYQHGSPLVVLSGEVSRTVLGTPELEDRLGDRVTAVYNEVHQTNYTPRNVTGVLRKMGDAFLRFIGLSRDIVRIDYGFKPQSDALRVNSGNKKSGDSGNPIAVAYRQGPVHEGVQTHLPWERYLSVGIRDLIDDIYQNDGIVPSAIAEASGVKELKGLRADGKIGVNVVYDGARLASIDKITIAAEHEESLSIDDLRYGLSKIVQAYISGHITAPVDFTHEQIVINGADAWHVGGWQTDEGTREAKSYRDGFGADGVVEDSFSGEDPSKPSGTGTYLARYIAVQVVSNGLADFAKVTLDYTIGRKQVGVYIETRGTETIPVDDIERWVRDSVDLSLSSTIERFGLKNSNIYQGFVRDSDFFQDVGLPWNKANDVEYVAQMDRAAGE
jgi:S-adenosylmethionine synthetase